MCEVLEGYTLEDRLLPINTLLGLLLPNEVNSPALASAGFQLAGLEVPAGGPSGSVIIDLVLFHAETNHLVVLESKSGANLDERQARAYAQLTAAKVVQTAYVTLAKRTPPPAIEVAYLCLARHADRIRQGLDQLSETPQIISVSSDVVRLDGADASPQLRAAFVDSEIQVSGPVPG